MKGLGEVHGYKYLYLQNGASKCFQIWKLARTSMDAQNDIYNLFIFLIFFFTKMFSPPLLSRSALGN